MNAITRRGILRAGAGAALAAGTATVTTQGAEAAKPRDLSVLALNIWLGGEVIKPGLSLVADVIDELDPDVVLLSESGDSTARLVEMLRARGQQWWFAPNGDTGIMSRLPIIEQGTLPYLTKAVIDVDGRQVALYATHLEYRWYATYLPRGYGGGSPTGPFAQYGWDQIPTGPVTDLAALHAENLASGRPAVMDAFLADAKKEQAKKRSVILGGDFNEPSALDWTEATKDLYDHHGVVIEWASTQKLMDAGYTDAYRAVFPNPVTHPGMTWPANNELASVDQLAWAPKADERDRIDYIFASPSPGLKLLDAGIIGPSGDIVRGERTPNGERDDVLASPNPWPSDHKGVLATYRLAGPKAAKR